MKGSTMKALLASLLLLTSCGSTDDFGLRGEVAASRAGAPVLAAFIDLDGSWFGYGTVEWQASLVLNDRMVMPASGAAGEWVGEDKDHHRAHGSTVDPIPRMFVTEKHPEAYFTALGLQVAAP
jgi:hypothetical protein